MYEIIKALIALFGGFTVLELGIYLIIDTIKILSDGAKHSVLTAVADAFAHTLEHLPDTIVFQLIRSLPNLIVFVIRLIPKLVLIILDVPIALIWSLVPGLKEVIDTPKISEIV